MSSYHKRTPGADVILPFILLALVFGGLFWQKYHEADQLPKTPPGSQGQAAVQKAVLFFATDDARLAREAREIESCIDRTTCLRSLLEELFRGPVNDLTPVVPEWTVVNSVSINGSLAAIDLDNDFLDSLPSGSASEMLAVYAIVNTICINMPEIQQVLITLNGQPNSHLRHLDLSEPLAPDLSLEQQAQPAVQRKPM